MKIWLLSFSTAAFLAVSLFSALLFSAPLFAANPPSSVNRQPMVRSAFEAFRPVIYFLSGAEDFRAMLTPEEDQQFTLLGNQLIAHYLKLAPPPDPGSGNTSLHINFKLRFSHRREDFILNPGEPERTAKVTEDVWFNLNIINNPQNEFNFLDALQIMFHEFGHKLGGKKDQEAIDRIAAKIRNYLLPYYRTHRIQDDLSAVSFILPYLIIHGGPMGMQAEPIILMNRRGHYIPTTMAMKDLIYTDGGYTEAGFPVQDYKRVVVKPEFQAFEEKFRVIWDVQIRHYLIEAPVRFNYLRLITRPESVANEFAVAPFQQNRLFQFDFTHGDLNDGKLNMKPQRTKSRHHSPQFGEWREEFRKINEGHFEAVITSDVKITEASVTGSLDDEDFEFPTKVEEVGQSLYRISLHVPITSQTGSVLYLKTLNLNGQHEWALPEIVKVQTQREPTPPLKITWIAAGTNEGWKDIRELGSFVEANEARLLFKIRAAKLLSHLEITWQIFEDVYQGDRRVARRTRTIFEVFHAEDLDQRLENGILSFSFRSKKMLEDRSGPSLKNFRIRELRVSGIQFLKMVTQDLQHINLNHRMAPEMSAFASVFQLPPVCHSLL